MKIEPGKNYTKLTRYEGSDSATLEVVDGEEVKNFVSAVTISFFQNLGGTEEVKRHANYIEVRSTSPDGSIVKITRFGRTDLPTTYRQEK